MKFKLTFFILNLFTYFTLISCGDTPNIIPLEFIETVPPIFGSNEWYSLNYSRNEFAVKIIDGQLKVEKVDLVKTCELSILNGKIVGIDRGEWGGTLIFVPADTTKSKVEIKRGNIKFIFSFKDKIYFIEGLAHLSMSSGALFELNNTNNSFTCKKIIDFDDAPEAFTIYKDKFLVATHEKFYVVKDFKKELILQDAFWSSLYPNSIAVLNEKNVFIGIRSGIVKLDLSTKKLNFYKNDK